MKKLTAGMFASTALLAWTQAANAGFVVGDTYGSLTLPEGCDPGSATLVCNNFADDLRAETGVVGPISYWNEGVLYNYESGGIFFTVYAWEAALENSVSVGSLNFDTLSSGSIFTDWSVKASGFALHDAGRVDVTFCTDVDTATPKCVVTADNGASNPLNDLARGIGYIIDPSDSNVVWLLWDDTGLSEQDDNHDDMIVRAEFKRVPEPATLGMLALGLLGIGAGLRRRQ